MEEQQQHIDDWFRQELGAFEEMPPAAVWNRLDERLDKKKRRRVIGWWLSGAVLLCLLGAGVWYSKSSTNSENAEMLVADKADGLTGPVSENNSSSTYPKPPSTLSAPDKSEANEPAPIATRDTASIATNQPSAVDAVNKSQAPEPTITAARPLAGSQKPVTKKERSVTANSALPTPAVLEQNPDVRQNAKSAPVNRPLKNNVEAVALANPAKADSGKVTTESEMGKEPMIAVRQSVDPRPKAVAASEVDKPLVKKSASATSESSTPAVGNAAGKTPTAHTDKPEKQRSLKNLSLNNVAKDETWQAILAAAQEFERTGKRTAISAANYKGWVENVTKAPTNTDSVAIRPAAATDTASGSRKNRFAGKLDFGVKLSYERGTKRPAVNKAIVSPYLQYHLSQKLALALQPGLRIAGVAASNLMGETPFYRNERFGVDTLRVFDSTGNPIQWIYHATKSYDSLRISTAIARQTMLEFELPILLQLQVASGFSVFGGMTFNFSKAFRVSESRTEYGSRTLSRDTVTFTSLPATYFQNLNFGTQNSQPYTSYNQNNAVNPSGIQLQMGYMAGFSANLSKGFFVDVAAQQSLGGVSYINNPTVRSLQKQPYVRFSLGYRLGKKGK